MPTDPQPGDNPNATKGERFFTMILNAPWASVLSIIVVVSAMLFVASVISGGGQKTDIRDTEYARGFITVLFCVGTIGIALLITLGAIFLNDANAKERFDRGKEVLGMLLGIFGTIIGFYYGTAATKPANPAASPQAPAAVSSPATNAGSGESAKRESSTKAADDAKSRAAQEPPAK